MIPPFVWIRGHPYLVANWDADLSEEEWLVLRPLSADECDAFEGLEETFFPEVFYLLLAVAGDDKRLNSFSSE